MSYHIPGPCSISWGNNDYASATVWGTTDEGIFIDVNEEWVPINDDEHAGNAADYIFGGRSLIVRATLVDKAKFSDIITSLASYPNWFKNGKASAGSLLSSIGQALHIAERDSSSKWVALKTGPQNPEAIVLAASSEVVLPVTFRVVPDDSGKLFSTTPSYISGA
jgi:hypothetical protein